MCVCVCVRHNMLHNSTHTIFLLHQMNQFLQNFLQHPEEAERGGKNIHHHHLHHHLYCRFPAWSIPALDVEVLPQHQVFEGGVPGERWDDSQQVSIQTCTQHNTHTQSVECMCNASNTTLHGAFCENSLTRTCLITNNY